MSDTVITLYVCLTNPNKILKYGIRFYRVSTESHSLSLIIGLILQNSTSGAIGFGAIFGQHWCYGKWPSDWAYRNIAILEFYPIVLSLYLWGHLMENQCIVFFTDNEALVHVINKQSCKDKQLMFFVRRLVLVCLRYNIVFKARHVPGSKNILADSLSRLQVETFRRLAPICMDQCPSDIPLHLQPQNWQP